MVDHILKLVDATPSLHLHYRDFLTNSGSGLVDLTALLLHCGIIDRKGLIRQQPANAENAFGERVAQKNDICDFLVAFQEDSFDQRNIFCPKETCESFSLPKE